MSTEANDRLTDRIAGLFRPARTAGHTGPVEDEAVEDEAVEDEPVEDEAVEDEPVEDEPAEAAEGAGTDDAKAARDTPAGAKGPAPATTAPTSGTGPDKAAKPLDLPPPNQMLPKEQQTGYLLAALIVAWVGAAGASRVVQGRSEYILLTALGVAAAGAVFYSVRRGRRMFGAITAVVAGLAVSGFFPLNFACLIYGGYIMLRQSQAQKKYNQVHPRQARQSGDRSFQSGRAAGRRGRDRAPEPKGPQASRRYTPPKSKTNTNRRAR